MLMKLVYWHQAYSAKVRTMWLPSTSYMRKMTIQPITMKMLTSLLG